MDRSHYKIFGSLEWRRIDLVLLIIIVMGAFLRFYNLGFQSAWLDEISTMQVSDPDVSFAETHTLVMTREGFPHFYFLGLKYLSTIFGHSIYVLRFYSAFFGTASIYIIYLLGKQLFGHRSGLIAAALLAVNFFHIQHSQEARCYSLLIFFILLSAFFLIKYIKTPSMINALWMGVTTGLIAHAHPLGLLNVGIVYAILGFFLVLSENRKGVIKQLLFAAISSILILVPIYQIVVRLSKFTSFWIPEPSLESIKQAFVQLLGSSVIVFYCYMFSLILFFALIIRRYINSEHSKEKRFQLIVIILVAVWLSLNIGVIILKSYVDISMILDRYFIGSLPAFILMLAYCVSLIDNKILRNVLVSAIISYSLYFIYDKDYYTTPTKAHWKDLAQEISDKNIYNDKIYSIYGYVTNILFKNTSSYNLMKEIDFPNYLRMVKNNTIEKESFWYFDGNNRPYILSAEDQRFLEENYILDYNIEKLDCWARHYTLKDSKKREISQSQNIFLSSFNPKVIDNNGNLLMFSDGTISTQPISMAKGKYELTLHGNSLPEKQVGNESAHIVIKVDDRIIGQSFLSEDPAKKVMNYKFTITDNSPKIISLTFDNDYAKGSDDRNLILYFIQIKRIAEQN